MKSLLRNTIIDAFSLFIASQVLSGIKIEGGIMTFVFAGLALTIMTAILRPILNLITLPLNIATLGVFSFFVNVVIIYLLTVFIPQVKISSFIFSGMAISGFVIPKIMFNSFFAFVAASFTISIIISFLKWLIIK